MLRERLTYADLSHTLDFTPSDKAGMPQCHAPRRFPPRRREVQGDASVDLVNRPSALSRSIKSSSWLELVLQHAANDTATTMARTSLRNPSRCCKNG